MDILNSREWAILIWLLLAIGYFTALPKRRPIKGSLKSLIKAFLSRHILSVTTLMSIYVALIIYVLFIVGVWDLSQLKTTIIWYFTVATLSLFRLEHYKEAPHRLRDMVIDNLRLVGIIEYLVGIYTFHLAIELILVPVLFVLGSAVALAETKLEYQPAHKFLNGVLSIIVISILGAVVYLMATDFGKVISRESAYDFVVPLFLSVAYTPFIIFMMVYSTYQNVLIKLRSSIKRRPLELYARLAALLVFNIRISLLERWATNVAKRNIKSVADINQSIRQVFDMVAREKNPPEINRLEEWSPYEAKDYLISEGIKTLHYHPVDPADAAEWFCCSELVEFGDGLFSNNIAYYLNGDKYAVKSMKLKLNVNAPEHASQAHAKLLSAATVLMRNALGLELTDVLHKVVTAGDEGTIEGPDFKIVVTKNIWPSHAIGGYDLGLELSGI